MGCFVQMQEKDMYIRVPAELDHHSAERIRKEADRILESRQVRWILFDFTDTEFMDSSGIGMIMGRYRAAARSGGEVLAVCVSERIKKILTISGLHKIIAIYTDMPELSGAGQRRGKHGV